MDSLKVIPNLKENNRYKSEESLSPAKVHLDLPDLQEAQHSHSLCEYARSSSFQISPKTVQSPDALNKTDYKGHCRKSSRPSSKLEYMNKIEHEEFEPEAGPRPRRPIFELYKSKDGDSMPKKKKEKKDKKKDGQGGDLEKQKEDKKTGLGFYGIKVLKNTFKTERRKRGRSSTTASAKTHSVVDDLGSNELDEKDHVQINQVSRPNINLKSVVSRIINEQQQEIAQEENPLSNGQVRVSLQQSMRLKKGQVDFKAKTVDDGELRVAEVLKINLEEPYVGKSSDFRVSEEFTREEKIERLETKTTLEAVKPKKNRI